MSSILINDNGITMYAITYSEPVRIINKANEKGDLIRFTCGSSDVLITFPHDYIFNEKVCQAIYEKIKHSLTNGFDEIDTRDIYNKYYREYKMNDIKVYYGGDVAKEYNRIIGG